MASLAFPIAETDGAEWRAAPAPAAYHPEPAIRTLDWACCAAPSILAAWKALAQCAAEPNPFFESWYLLPALRGLDPGESVQMLLFEIDGDLAGLMPVAREKRYYGKPIGHLASWSHANGFLGAPLVARGLEREFWQALLEWSDRQSRSGLFFHLAGLPLDGPLHAALESVLDEQARPWGLVHCEDRAMLQSDQSPEAYFSASLSGKKRKELRRQLNRLSEEGEVSFRRDNDEFELAEWIVQFLELEEAGWKGKAGSAMAQSPATEGLFRQSLAGAASQSKLERLSLTLDGKPLAMLANFILPPGAFSYKTAFDESYSRFSPGVLLQCDNLLMLDRAEVQWTDSCASAGHPMIDHIWRERRAVGRLSIGIGGRVRRAAFRQLLRAELSRNPTGVKR